MIYRHENELHTISVSYSMVHKHDFHSPGWLSVNACKRELTLRFQSWSIFEIMILNNIFKTISIIKAEVWPIEQQCVALVCASFCGKKGFFFGFFF